MFHLYLITFFPLKLPILTFYKQESPIKSDFSDTHTGICLNYRLLSGKFCNIKVSRLLIKDNCSFSDSYAILKLNVKSSQSNSYAVTAQRSYGRQFCS